MPVVVGIVAIPTADVLAWRRLTDHQTKAQVMRLTDAAAARIKEVMANAGSPGRRRARRRQERRLRRHGIHHGIRRRASTPTDEVVEDKGVKILIDPKAVLFLLGTEMDYKTEKLSAQFVFNNPNQTSACGCGEVGAARRRPAGRAE